MKNTEVILAGVLGVVSVFGIIALKRILKNKPSHSSECDYSNIFGKPSKNPYFSDGESVEINAFL